MKSISSLALAFIMAVCSAQQSAEIYSTLINAGGTSTRPVTPIGLNFQGDGNLSVSSRMGGNGSPPTSWFSKLDFSTGHVLFNRQGITYSGPIHTTLGPGFRVAHVGGSVSARAQVFNGVGTTLMNVADNFGDGAFNWVNHASAFDGAGNLYVAGSATFVYSPGVSGTYVAKYNAQGVQQWVVKANLREVNGTPDLPIGIGINTQGDVWVAIRRGTNSTHVWRMNGVTGHTQFGSVWQIDNKSTIPTTARMVNNRFVVAGYFGDDAFVRQYITTSNWITTPIDVSVVEQVKGIYLDPLSASSFYVSLSKVDGPNVSYMVEKINTLGTRIGGFELGDMVELSQLHMMPGVAYVVGSLAGGDTVVSAVPVNGAVAPVRHIVGRAQQSERYSVANSSGEVGLVTFDVPSSKTRLTKIVFGPQAVDDFTVYSNAALGVSGTVLDNDLNVNGATVSLTQGPTRGNLTLNANGTFQYTPEIGFETGTYEFTYQLTKPGFDPTTARFVMDLRP